MSIKDIEVLNLISKEININESVARKEFEDIIANDLMSIEDLVERTLQESYIQSSEVDVIATTGGRLLYPL